MAPAVSHFSKAYAPSKERAWHLSIWSAPSTQAWCVHDVGTNACVALAAGEGPDLPDAGRLPVHPVSVTFIAVPEISTLVPEGVLEGGREAAHLELVHGPLPTGLLRDEPIDALSARCIYLHDEGAERRLLTRYPGARPIALQALLIKSALALAMEAPQVLLHRGEDRCDLVVADKGRVLLANSFFAPTATDVLYFALFALDRTGLEPARVELRFGGMAITDEATALLDRYFPRMAPATPPDAPMLAGLPVKNAHRFHTLLQQWPCGS